MTTTHNNLVNSFAKVFDDRGLSPTPQLLSRLADAAIANIETEIQVGELSIHPVGSKGWEWTYQQHISSSEEKDFFPDRESTIIDFMIWAMTEIQLNQRVPVEIRN